MDIITKAHNKIYDSVYPTDVAEHERKFGEEIQRLERERILKDLQIIESALKELNDMIYLFRERFSKKGSEVIE